MKFHAENSEHMVMMRMEWGVEAGLLLGGEEIKRVGSLKYPGIVT